MKNCFLLLALFVPVCVVSQPYEVSYLDYFLLQSFQNDVSRVVDQQQKQNRYYQQQIESQRSYDNLLLRQSIDRLGW